MNVSFTLRIFPQRGSHGRVAVVQWAAPTTPLILFQTWDSWESYFKTFSCWPKKTEFNRCKVPIMTFLPYLFVKVFRLLIYFERFFSIFPFKTTHEQAWFDQFYINSITICIYRIYRNMQMDIVLLLLQIFSYCVYVSFRLKDRRKGDIRTE